MLKVTHFLRSVRNEHGGVVRFVLDLCGALAKSGTRIRLLTCDDTDVPDAWKTPSANYPELIHVNPKTLSPWKKTSDVIESTLKDSDVLHIHSPWETMNLPLALAAKRRQLPYVISTHGMLDNWSMRQKPLKKRLYMAMAGKRLLESSSAVHCTAEAELTQACRWFPQAHGVVLPLVMDLSPFADLPGPELAEMAFTDVLNSKDQHVLLFLSRLHPKKGAELLIEATKLLKDRGVRCKVVMAGPYEAEYRNKLELKIKADSLNDSVHIIGEVRGQQKVSLYQRADIFVLPTHQENFGLVLPEAMACGTPVVTTRGVDTWRELEAAGSTIVTRNAASIARAIETLLADPHQLKILGNQARTWVHQELNPRQVSSQYEDLYNDLANTNAKSLSISNFTHINNAGSPPYHSTIKSASCKPQNLHSAE